MKVISPIFFLMIGSFLFGALGHLNSQPRFHFGKESFVADQFFAPLLRQPKFTWYPLEYICGGTWIHELFVLTTAYCLKYHGDINRVGYLIPTRTSWQMEEYETFHIANFYYFKNYRLDGIKVFENDIGLIKINPRLSKLKKYNPLGFFPKLFNDWKNPIDIEGAKVVLFGFGRTEKNEYAPKLKYMAGRLKLHSRGKCTIPACNDGLSFRFEPLGTKERFDNGDMGSPVYYNVDDPNHLKPVNRVIIGILSNAYKEPRNIILTNVTRYQEWIDFVIYRS